MAQPTARDRFLDLLRASVRGGTLVKLTLGNHRGADASLKNLFVRPVVLKAGPQLSFVYRHATRDITKNHPVDAALAILEPLIGTDFLDAHLFTPVQNAQLTTDADGKVQFRLKNVAQAPEVPPTTHDRARAHLVALDAAWMHALGVTNGHGQLREGMAPKYRQINKFAELLTHLLSDAALPSDRRLQVVDMGSGKGYLTFAVASLLADRADVIGVEARADLVEFCQREAVEARLSNLRFATGSIAETPLPACDVLIALHACDTATDDAIAKGIAVGARLVVVSPCCQKELRPQLTPPPVLADALSHGIFQERQAEFVTDALRAQLLEWAGYRTKVFEFVSTEHTARNLMIAAIKTRPAAGAAAAAGLREFARFYGIKSQRLASLLGVTLG